MSEKVTREPITDAEEMEAVDRGQPAQREQKFDVAGQLLKKLAQLRIKNHQNSAACELILQVLEWECDSEMGVSGELEN